MLSQRVILGLSLCLTWLAAGNVSTAQDDAADDQKSDVSMSTSVKVVRFLNTNAPGAPLIDFVVETTVKNKGSQPVGVSGEQLHFFMFDADDRPVYLRKWVFPDAEPDSANLAPDKSHTFHARCYAIYNPFTSSKPYRLIATGPGGASARTFLSSPSSNEDE